MFLISYGLIVIFESVHIFFSTLRAFKKRLEEGAAAASDVKPTVVIVITYTEFESTHEL